MNEDVPNASFVGPPAKPRISVEDEASLMNRGTMRNLSYLVAGAIVLIGLGVLLVQRLGRVDAYAEAAKSTAVIGNQHFNGFFDCALPGTPTSELNAQRVQTGLSRLGDRTGKSYGQTLTKCLPQMRALTQGTESLRVPAMVKDQQAALVAASSELAAANTQYLYYLSDGIAPYDTVAATPMQKRFGAAWAGYRRAETDLEEALAQRP
jgi:hypothetical protein